MFYLSYYDSKSFYQPKGMRVFSKYTKKVCP